MTTIPYIDMLTVLVVFGIGLYTLLITRNMIKIVIALQILVKVGMIALVLAGRMTGQVMTGQSMALTVIVADTIVAVIGLALAVQVKKHLGTVDLNNLRNLKG